MVGSLPRSPPASHPDEEVVAALVVIGGVALEEILGRVEAALALLPVSVEKQLDKIMRQFLWGSSKQKSKKSWVDWKTVYLPKERGGVGIKKLRIMNKKLHAKWIWRYGNEERALWRKVVHHKFGGNQKAFLPNQTSNSVGKSLWSGILKSASAVELNSVIQVNIGDMNLKESEVEDISHLLNLLPNINSNSGSDQRIWQAGNHGFSVAECYKALEDEGLIMFPYKYVWNPRIPQKVVFFTWTLCYNAAPTLDSYKNSIVVNGCLLCKKAAESNQHIFLHCETTRNVIWEWRRKKGAAISIKKWIWDIYPFAIWWAIWIERNDRLFNGRYKTLDSIINGVKTLVFNCCVGRDIFQGYSLNTVWKTGRL
ncbi:uncharacterized protein LOC113272188 [Papaver somniferum]|uniref:uncharacterized protein LOC113272188 n=1 Tax=Papaver somniferum TaxID=3469 RepID=UPI000E6F5C44|nr:uncharacterized protein LOC113272188 [Papaver somniferum]